MAKVLKCWNCIYLGECEELKPCEKFKRYYYKKEKLTFKYVAVKTKIPPTTLRRALKEDEAEAIKIISQKLGYEVIRVSVGTKRHIFEKV